MILVDYYKILGITFDASGQDIKNAYRQLARKFHPDIAGDDEFCKERFKEIQEAYDVLSHPKIKQSYNLAYRRFRKNAHVAGNLLYKPDSGSRNKAHVWQAKDYPRSGFLNWKKSLFIGLGVMVITLSFAALFYNGPMMTDDAASAKADIHMAEVPFSDSVSRPALTDRGQEPIRPKISPAVSPAQSTQPATKAALNEHDKTTVAETSLKKDLAPRLAALQPITPAGITRTVPSIAVLSGMMPESLSVTNLPTASTNTVRPQRFVYWTFNVQRTTHRAGFPDKLQTVNYVSDIRPVNIAGPEEEARLTVAAEASCSQRESRYAASHTTPQVAFSYRIEKRMLNMFETMDAATKSRRREQQSLDPERSPKAAQYGYMIFVVRRQIHNLINGEVTVQHVSYTSAITPYSTLMPQQKGDLVVKADALCSHKESRYAMTHSDKKAAIDFLIVGRNLKLFKTEELAASSLRNEPASIDLEQ